jgi:hypothetical protein
MRQSEPSRIRLAGGKWAEARNVRIALDGKLFERGMKRVHCAKHNEHEPTQRQR